MIPIFLQGSIYDQVFPQPHFSQPGPAAHVMSTFDYLCWAIIIVLVLWFLSILTRPKKALKHWHHHFAGLHLPSKEVYGKIVAEIEKRQMPDVRLYYTKHFEAGIFTARRGYLSLEYKKFYLDVCCVQFGTGYYMSWWLGEADPGLFSRIPILRDIFGLHPDHQSYYQLDTANLFQSAAHDAVMKVIEEISNDHGIRPLTEFERQPQPGGFQSNLFH